MTNLDVFGCVDLIFLHTGYRIPHVILDLKTSGEPQFHCQDNVYGAFIQGVTNFSNYLDQLQVLTESMPSISIKVYYIYCIYNNPQK